MKTFLFRLFIVLFLLSFVLLGATCGTAHCAQSTAYSAEVEQKSQTQENAAVRSDSVKLVATGEENKELPSVATQSETIDLRQDLSKLKYLEEPIATDTTLEVFYNLGFTFAFSPRYKQSVWVAYQFLPSELQKVTKREGAFKQDPRVSETANNGDYKRTGYDKGHLAPAADMAWSSQAMKESFYFTNISPQLAAFNRRKWKDLEEQVRRWVEQNDTLYVTTGPLFLEDMRTIGHNLIPVPSHFYKALLTRNAGHWKAVGFLLRNEESKMPLDSFRCTIDSLERVSGLDFFPLLADSIEVKIEREYDKSFWHAK